MAENGTATPEVVAEESKLGEATAAQSPPTSQQEEPGLCRSLGVI